MTEYTALSIASRSKIQSQFNEARESEGQWHHLGHMQVCISLQTDNYVSIPLLFSVFFRPDALPANSIDSRQAIKLQ